MCDKTIPTMTLFWSYEKKERNFVYVCVWGRSWNEEKQRDKTLTLVFLFFTVLPFSSLLYQHLYTHTHATRYFLETGFREYVWIFLSSCFPVSLSSLFSFVIGTSLVPLFFFAFLFSPLLFFLIHRLQMFFLGRMRKGVDFSCFIDFGKWHLLTTSYIFFDTNYGKGGRGFSPLLVLHILWAVI